MQIKPGPGKKRDWKGEGGTRESNGGVGNGHSDTIMTMQPRGYHAQIRKTGRAGPNGRITNLKHEFHALYQRKSREVRTNRTQRKAVGTQGSALR